MAKRPALPYYLLFTVCFTGFWFLFKLGGTIDAGAALRSTAVDTTLNVAALILTVEWLLPNYFYPGRYPRFGLGLAAIILTGGAANILLQLALIHSNLWQYQAKLHRYKDHFLYWFWSDLVAGSFFMIAFISLTGFAIRLAFDRVLTAQRLAESEAARLRSELESLRNQVNPHFLFNALNTIYYRIDKSNAAARSLTQQFSALLRYQLYECNDATVKIENEMRCIENYVELQKHRAGDQLAVTARGFETLSGFTIPPHLLMPLVENCFKHVSHFPDRPNYIQLFCQRENDRFLFHTTNSFDPSRPPALPGIGLATTRKRLDLLCRDKYTLTTSTDAGRFETTLQLSLS
jgi:two-component system, LytTR family, sensor kinase